MESKIALVTGATGFVGRHLCPELIKSGYKVRGTFRKGTPTPKMTNVEWIAVDPIGAKTNWDAALGGGISSVIHLAALAHRIDSANIPSDNAYDEINHLGTAKLAQAVARTSSIRRFLFISSIGATTSSADKPVNEQTPSRPDTPYGWSKLAAENAVRDVLGRTRSEWCILRPPLLYGAGNPGNMNRLLQLTERRMPLPLGSIRNRRTFLYVGNLIHAIKVAVEHPESSRELFCVGDDQDLSTPELIRALAGAAGRSARLFPFPILGLRMAAKAADIAKKVTGCAIGLDTQSLEKLCGSLPVDSSLFRMRCSWHAPFTVEDGMRATIGKQEISPATSPEP